MAKTDPCVVLSIFSFFYPPSTTFSSNLKEKDADYCYLKYRITAKGCPTHPMPPTTKALVDGQRGSCVVPVVIYCLSPFYGSLNHLLTSQNKKATKLPSYVVPVVIYCLSPDHPLISLSKKLPNLPTSTLIMKICSAFKKLITNQSGSVA